MRPERKILKPIMRCSRQIKKRLNAMSASAKKIKKKSKAWYEKGCVNCGRRNKCNLDQKKILCESCNKVYK